MTNVLSIKKIKEFHTWANSKMVTLIHHDDIERIVTYKHSSSALLDAVYAIMQDKLAETTDSHKHHVKRWVYAHNYLLLVNRNSSSELLLKVFTFLYGDDPLTRGLVKGYDHDIYSKSVNPLLQHPNVTRKIVLKVYKVLKESGRLGKTEIIELLSSKVLTTPDKIKIAEYFVTHPPKYNFLKTNWPSNIVEGLVANRNPADLIQYTFENYDISV